MAQQLQPIPIVTPGFKGLNKSQSSVPDLDPGWATECQNFVIDSTGRLASRNGWTSLCNSAGSTCTNVVELAKNDGTKYLVFVSGNGLYLSNGFTPPAYIQGAFPVPSPSNYAFATFNNALYATCLNQQIYKFTGTGSFTAITASSGTVPTTNGCILSAFGRLWAVGTDNQTVYYSNLLDETAWGGVGAGSINMATVWTRGTDQVMAIAAAGSHLVIFGTKQIVIYADTNSGVIGLNPNATTFGVYDTIEGTGCAARDTVQSTGEGDLTFLSPTGVQSLQRLLSSGKDNPVASLDQQIRDYFQGYFLNEIPQAVRAAYSPANRFYLILLPVSQRIFCYDTKQRLDDGSLRVTEWPSVTHGAVATRTTGDLLFGTSAGTIGLYSGYLDGGASYTILLNTPDLAISPNFENRRKILKKMKAVIYFGGNVTVNFFWGVDFKGLTNTKSVALTGTLSEYNIAQYSINEYGGGAGLTIADFPVSLTGRWLKFGVSSVISNFPVAIQQLDAFVKLGNFV